MKNTTIEKPIFDQKINLFETLINGQNYLIKVSNKRKISDFVFLILV